MANIDIKISGLNLLRWSNMEDWVNGTSSSPTEHTLTGTGATIAREATTIKTGTYSAAVTRNSNDSTLYHDLTEYADYQGRKVTFGCWVHASVASRARLSISDGIGSTESSYHSGGGDWEFLTVTHNVDSSATRLRCEMQLNNGDTTVYFDNGILCDGNTTLTILSDIADWGGRKLSNRYVTQEYSVPRREGQRAPNMRIESKTLSYDAMVIGATPTAKRTNMDSLQSALNSFRKKPNGDIEPRQLYFFDDRYFNCFVDRIEPEDIAASRISRLNIRFNIFDPFEYAVNMTRSSNALSGDTSFTVTNGGTATALPIITITNDSSNISSLTIENLTTGQKIGYTGTLATSNDLVIDSDNLTVKNNGTDDLGNVSNEIGIILVPGDNEFLVTGVPAGTALVDWRDRWY